MDPISNGEVGYSVRTKLNGVISSHLEKVGSAFVGGDKTGSTRGARAIDIRSKTAGASFQVASGTDTIGIGDHGGVLSYDGICIGRGSYNSYGYNSVAIGRNSQAYYSANSVAIGRDAYCGKGDTAVAIGYQARTYYANNAVAVGPYIECQSTNTAEFGWNDTAKIRIDDDMCVLFPNSYFAGVPSASAPTSGQFLFYVNTGTRTFNVKWHDGVVINTHILASFA